MQLKFVFFFERMNAIKIIKTNMVFRCPLNSADNFLLENNVILLYLESLKEKLVFHDLSYVLKHKQDIFFLFLAYKTLRAIVRLFSETFFQSIFSDRRFIHSHLYLFVNGLIFVIPSKKFSYFFMT